MNPIDLVHLLYGNPALLVVKTPSGVIRFQVVLTSAITDPYIAGFEFTGCTNGAPEVWCGPKEVGGSSSPNFEIEIFED